ncbi:hypothetical protein Tco_1269621 [Tanacetum coccineum]
MDEQWFTLNADLLCIDLGITPKDSAHPFMPPPAGDLVIDFVNNLGYPEELQFVSKMYVNSLYQPWRTILSMINQCLTGKTSSGDRHRHPEIKNFFSDAANLKVPTKKPKPHVIPYCCFTKLIIYYLGSRHNVHRRPQSPIHIVADDYPLSNLKFVSKGGVDKVFGMAIPKDLITEAIQNSEYYKKYLEMAAHKPRQPTTKTGEEGGKKKKAPKADKSKQPSPAKQTKPVKEKTSKPTPSKKIHNGRVMKVCKEKRSDHLVDEEDEESQPTTEPQVEDDEYNLQRGIQMSLESLHEQGQGRQAPIGGVAIRETDPGLIRKLLKVEGNRKGIVTEEQAAQSLLNLQKPKKKSITDQYIFQNSTNDADNVVDMELSTSKSDTKILNVDKEHGEEVSHIVALEERTVKLDEGQVGSDPGKTPESRPLPEEDQARSDPGQSHVAQAGPNPEPMHEDFIAIVYPAVHKNLKLTTEEQVHIKNPPSSSRTLSSMNNLEDAFTFGDQFINDKSMEEEPGKGNVETKVESMIVVPIYQASSLVTPLSTPIIDLTPPKTNPDLATRVSTLEKRSAEFEQKHQLKDKTTKALASRVYKLEHHDLYSKINKQPPVQKSSAWKTSDTREAPSISSKQKPASPPVVDNNPIPDDMHLSESEDTDVAHLLKIKTRLDWLNPLSEEASETPEPDWVIPPNNLLEIENNWVDALAKMYKDSEENKLL